MRSIGMLVLAGSTLLVGVGCGSSQPEVHGIVTANGKNIEDGFISFMPLDDKNQTHGAQIAKGRYSARVNPGKYSVMVTGGGKAVAYPKSQADLKAIPDKDLEVSDQVPAEAKGNGQTVEVKPGGQELNITLEYKTRK